MVSPQLINVEPPAARIAEPWAQSIPSLTHMLATAKLACTSPEALSAGDVENLAKVVLVYYASMGVRY